MQKISREQPDAAASPWSALGWCPGAAFSPPGLRLLGARRAQGGFFSSRGKKNQSAFSSAAHIRAGCKKTCSLPPETPQLLQQLQSAETASLCHPPLPQNKVEQGKWRGGGKGNGRDDPQQPRLLHALFPPQHGCCVPVGTDKHLVSRSLRFHSADLQPGTAWQSTISSQPAHPTHPHAAGRGCDAGDAAGSAAAMGSDGRIKPSCAAISLLFKSVSAWFPALCHPASIKAHGFPWCCSLQYLMTGGRAVLRNTSVLPCEQKVASRGQSRQEKPLAVNFSGFCSN